MTPSTLIPVELIDPNPQQPRTEFDPAALQELADSISEHGLIQPVIVSRAGERYILTAGERRLRAAKLAGLSEIPGHIEGDFDDSPAAAAERRQRAVVENLQRQDMNPIEIAESLQAMKDADGLSDEQIAQKVGKGRVWVANKRALLKLPGSVLARIGDGPEHVSERVAMRLLPATKIKPHEMENAGLTNQPDFNVTYGDPPTPNILFRRVATKNDLTSDQVDLIIKRIQERVAQANRKETRYCRNCGAAREFNARELDNTGLSTTCLTCGKSATTGRWYTGPDDYEAARTVSAPTPATPQVLASAPLPAEREPARSQLLADRVKADAAQRVEQAKPMAEALAGLKKSPKPKENGQAAPKTFLAGAAAIITVRLFEQDEQVQFTLSAALEGKFPSMRRGQLPGLAEAIEQAVNELYPHQQVQIEMEAN